MPAMSGVPLALAAALGCWVMTGYKLRQLIGDPGNLPLRQLCLALAAFTLPITIDPFGARLDRAVGMLDVGRVAGACLTMVAAGAAQNVLLYLPDTGEDTRRRVRRRTLTMACCVALTVGLFVLTPARYRLTDPSVRSGAYYTATPTLAAAPYLLVYLGYVAWVALQGALLSVRYAGSATRMLLRLGLRLAAAGSILGLGYLAVKVAASIAATGHSGHLSLADRLTAPLYTTTTATLLVGATIPSWGARIRLDRAWANLAARRDCRRLHPLWELIHQAVPEVALLPHPARPGLRRVRTIVEILDGYVQLAPWATETAAQRARALAAGRPDPDASAEAALLRLAARDKRAGQAPPGDPAVALPAASPLRCDGETDAVAQVTWLTRVARALRQLPVPATPAPPGDVRPAVPERGLV
jgi:hypothetical protein